MTSKFDPTLSKLFALSLGPVQSVPISKSRGPPKPAVLNSSESQANDLSSKAKHDADSNAVNPLEAKQEGLIDSRSKPTNGVSRKRKLDNSHDDLEAKYLAKLHREDIRDESKRRKASDQEQRDDGELVNSHAEPEDASENGDQDLQEVEQEEEEHNDPMPQHETLGEASNQTDIEQASRTVFLGNVSNQAIKSRSAKKILLDHLSSILPTLPQSDPPHKIESLRFRSTAFSDTSRPRKAAYAKGELMDATTKSTNAYVVYSTKAASREAARKLNGTIVLDRHLRVDEVAHPAKVDHRRCVFVGNLGFVDDESNTRAAEDESKDRPPRKVKPPADIEEGLWRQFKQAGAVESVRVVRDKVTRVGKGIAYVQFKDYTGVEKALSYDGKKFPPLLPRILRVTRAKKVSKTSNRQANHTGRAHPSKPSTGTYRPKPSSEALSLKGRSGKLLGRAAAAQFRGKAGRDDTSGISERGAKADPARILEGHRAKSSEGKSFLKMGRSSKNKGKGKPQGRSSRRGAAFKAEGRKKSGRGEVK